LIFGFLLFSFQTKPQGIIVFDFDGVKVQPARKRVPEGHARRISFPFQIHDVSFPEIFLEEVRAAKERFLTGTSPRVPPVMSRWRRRAGQFFPGPVCSKLPALLWEEIRGPNPRGMERNEGSVG
jgi:hypothetical protein